ncbi:ABC transporter ATP-binding protein [Qipengyuania nanhaisediminis]|uniref:ABC transporter ATP-binding protein n=1 Tax=Qipengyuania nanhaisediminis TaxID=604088 RepID=UPI0038B2D789
MLGCEDLSIMRGRRLVLDRVSVRLEPGAVTVIVGPNGAGKSTLLMALAGLLPPAAGRVGIDDRPLSDMKPRERAKRIGYLPQDAEIAWDVAVENLVALGRMPHRDAARAPVERALAVMELEALRERPASRLSGGEKARVLLARVLAGEPAWICADEPLAALDLAHRASLIAHLSAEAARGTGVLIVMHDLASAMNHADRVLVLREGRLVADGAPRDALSEEVIANTWGMECEWIGLPGRHALVPSNRD